MSGQRMGRFEIRGRLGAGAFATVYRAWDPELEREVALKVPHSDKLNTPHRVARFLGDAKAAARLRHPHIVPVFDAGKDGEQFYIASALVPGRTLKKALMMGALDFRASVRIVRALAEALAYAHEQGVIHRDVKPDNVVLDDQDQPHLIDFGLAHRAEHLDWEPVSQPPDFPDSKETPDAPVAPETADKTQAGAIMGTPVYMAPEAALGGGQDKLAKLDQYSLGATLYELLLGRTPFQGPPHLVLYNVARRAPPAPRTLNPNLPRDLEEILRKAMAKRPDDRYPSCQEFAADLEEWLEGREVSVRPQGYLERFVLWARREPLLLTALAAAALSLVAVVVIFAVSAHSAWLRERQMKELNQELTEQNDKEKVAKKQAERAQKDAEDRREDLKRHQDLLVEEIQEKEEAKKKEKELRAEAEGKRLEAERLKERALRNEYFTRIALAERELRDGQPTPARELLQLCPEKLRGWEWGLLDRQAHGSGQTAKTHPVLTVNHDAAVLAWTEGDNHILLRRRTHPGVRKGILLEASGPVLCLAFGELPEGKINLAQLTSTRFKTRYLAAGCANGKIDVWKVENLEQPSPLPMVPLLLANEPVNALSFNRDCSLLASAAGNLVRVSTVEAPPRVLSLHQSDVVRSLTLVDDEKGTQLVTGNARPEVRLYRLPPRNAFEDKRGDGPGTMPLLATNEQSFNHLTTGAFHLWGQVIVGAKEGGTILVFKKSTNGKDLEKLCQFGEHRVNLVDVRVGYGNVEAKLRARLASLDAEGNLKVWVVAEGTNAERQPTVSAVELFTVKTLGGFGLSRDGETLAWINSNREVMLRFLDRSTPALAYQMKDGAPVKKEAVGVKLATYAQYNHDLVYSADGKFLVTGSSVVRQKGGKGLEQVVSGELAVWNARTGEQMCFLPTDDPVWAVAFSKQHEIIWGDNQGKIHFWRGWRNKDDKKEDRPLPGHTGAINALVCDPQGEQFISAGADGRVKVWSCRDGTLLHDLGDHTGEVMSLAWSKEGGNFATGDTNGKLILWDAKGPSASWQHPAAVNRIAFHPLDRNQLATACADGLVRLWDIAKGKVLHEFKGHSLAVLGVAFHPNGKRLASCSKDRTVRLWDIEPDRPGPALSLPTRSVPRYGLAFSPGGADDPSQLIVGTIEGFNLWESKPLE